MALSDIIYDGDLGRRLRIEVQTDDESWLDLNSIAPDPNYPVDYWGGLRAWPRVTIRTEETGNIISYSTSEIQMDNTPAYDKIAGPGNRLSGGTTYGLFDFPLPFTLRGKTISSWRRKVRISAEIYDANGVYVSTVTCCTMKIAKPIRAGKIAKLKVVSLQAALLKKSAATIKAGSDWFRDIPIATLIYQLLKRGDPTLDVDPAMRSQRLFLGVTPRARCTSWGGAPGAGTDGLPAAQRWIPRCFTTYQGSLYVGFEVHDGQQMNSSGALARFDPVAGAWTVLLTSASPLVTARYPIALKVSGSYIYMALYAENRPQAFQPFYLLQLGRCTLLGGSAATVGSAQAYWPCRETIRKGVRHEGTFNIDETRAGIVPSGDEYTCYGEPIMLPFEQRVEYLADQIWASTIDNAGIVWRGPYWGDYQTDPNDENNGWFYTGDKVLEPSAPGSYQGWWRYDGAVVTTHGGIRYAMGNLRQVPVIEADGGTDYVWFASLNTAEASLWFLMYRLRLSDGALSWWKLDQMGNASTQLWTRQVTAWCPVPAASFTRKFFVAEIEWDESITVNEAPPVSAVKLWLADCTGGASSSATMTLLWTPEQSALIKTTIVHLFRGVKTDGTPQAAAIAVLYNRAMPGGPCYGLAVLWLTEAGALAKEQVFGVDDDYTGPVSAMPFSAFSEDEDSAVRFLDQSTGQLWRVSWDAEMAVTWAIENDSMPAHATEHFAAAERGVKIRAADASDGYARAFLALAPGPQAELSLPYFNRTNWSSNSLRRQPGVFPLIMHSTKPADVIEVADFSGMKVWEAVRQIMEMLVQYSLVVDSTGKFTLVERSAGTADLVLVDQNRVGGIPDYEEDEWAVTFEQREPIVEEIVNACDVIPYGPIPQENPEPQVLRAAGSEFAGEFLVRIATQRPLRLTVTCAVSGDPVKGVDDGGKLFRWSRVPDECHVFLASPCQSTDTLIYVGGLRLEGNRLFSGEQEIRVGDEVRITDARDLYASANLLSVAYYGLGSIRLTLDGPIGMTASAFADVTITPVNRSASDGPAGVTKLAAALAGTNVRDVSVADTAVLRAGMAIQVDGEMMRIDRVRSGSLVVTRAVFGSTRAAHASGAPIRAWIYCVKPGALYEVSDTGVFFGFSVPEDATPRERILRGGDGLVIQTAGMKIGKLEAATIRAMDQESQAAWDPQELPIDNRFVDYGKGLAIAQKAVSDGKDPRLGVVAEGALVPWLDLTKQVDIQEETVTAGQLAQFLPRSIDQDYQAWRMRVHLRAINATTGMGGKATPPDLRFESTEDRRLDDE